MDDAIGRSLAVAWFEKVEDTAAGAVLSRVAKEENELALLLQTLAEILRVSCFTFLFSVLEEAPECPTCFTSFPKLLSHLCSEDNC